MTYAYYIDDDDDCYVIRRSSLKRLFGDLIPGADFNFLGCRDLGNGIRLSYICRSKEQAAHRITPLNSMNVILNLSSNENKI